MGQSLVGGLGVFAGRMIVGERFADSLAEMKRVQWLSRDELLERNERRIVDMLRYAVEAVPFYQELGIRPEDIKDRSDLARFPVMSKADYRAQAEKRFLAEGLPAHRFQSFSTSGSTGTPFRFKLDNAVNPLIFSSHLFYDSWHDLGAFDRYMRVIVPIPPAPKAPQDTPALARMKQGLVVQLKQTYEHLTQRHIDLFTINDRTIETLHRTIETFKPAYIMGFTSALADIADHFANRSLTLSRPLKAVITIGEPLTDVRRDLIVSNLPGPIVNRYGQKELGYWSAQSSASDPDRFLINTELVTYECLRPDNTPAAIGEPGRLVVTDLHNRAMPFIRYETGDIGCLSDEESACGRGFPMLGRIEGRSAEAILASSERVVTPNRLSAFLFQQHDFLGDIREFQLEQSGPDAVVFRAVSQTLCNGRRDELEQALQSLLGSKTAIRIETVNEIPLEKSGKRPVIKACRPLSQTAN